MNALTLLISVPLTVGYLGAERYGVWMALSSFVGLLSVADFGIGNGLVNAVARASGRNDDNEASRYVSTAFFVFLSLAIIIAAVSLLLGKTIGWSWLFPTLAQDTRREAAGAFAVIVGCFLLSLPLGVVSRVQTAYQEGYVSSLWAAAGSLLGLLGVVVAAHFRAGIPALTLATFGLPILATFANAFHLFGRVRPQHRPRLLHFDSHRGFTLLRTGFSFFLLQLGASLFSQAPFLVIARSLGPAAVSPFAVAFKLLSLFTLAYGLALQPLWPAYAEALGANDIAWIRRTFFRSLRFTVLYSTAAAAIYLATCKYIIALWVGPSLYPGFVVAAALAVYLVANSLRYVASMCLNGCGRLVAQSLYQLPFALIGIFLAATLAIPAGLPGIVVAFALAEFSFVLCQLFETRRMLALQVPAR